MLFARKHTKDLEGYIIEILHLGEQEGPALFERILKTCPQASKETFYRILRTLLSQEVVNKHGKIYELNRHWLHRLYRFSKKHIEVKTDTGTKGILSMNEGDKITYTFKNPNLMGIYWAHTYDMIFEKHDAKIPILIFHPHQWLIYTRTESETFFLNRFAEDKKLVFFTIGGTTHLDKKFRLDWSHDFRQITTGVTYGLDSTTYINVLGDFIFKVQTSKKFGADIDVFFKKNKVMTSEALMGLQALCNRKDKVKMTLIKSKKESAKWRSKFKKYFFITKQYRDAFYA